MVYVTGPATINHVSTKVANFLSLFCQSLITIYTNRKKFTSNAEFNGLSSAIYRNRMLLSQLKILAKI